MMTDTYLWASAVYPALTSIGDIITCWCLLEMAIAAQKAIDAGKNNAFYQGKVMQAAYFTDVTLPLALARLETCIGEGREVVEMSVEAF